MKPQQNADRNVLSLDGLWTFRIDTGSADKEHWEQGIPAPAERLYVPASYNDQREDRLYRMHRGWAYYERIVTIPGSFAGQRIVLHFGSVTHDAKVWLDGTLIAEHRGGFLPFEVEITNLVEVKKRYRLTVACNNRIGHDTLPVGNEGGAAFFGSDNANVPAVQQTKVWRGEINLPNFDFFNYAGIHRHVSLYTTPKTYISDVTFVPQVQGTDGIVGYEICVGGGGAWTEAEHGLRIVLRDAQGQSVCETSCLPDSTGLAKGELVIPKVRLWEPWPGTPYLYEAEISIGEDSYLQKVGVRTVEVVGSSFYINGKPFYFKGFGKHEDFYVRGKGLDEALNVKDVSLLHWIGANSFRTSHYPYAEEMYDLCDEAGIVIIDETPAVGITTGGRTDPYKEFPLAEYHERVLRDLIARDRNHPCVVMWSLGNEPDTESCPESAYTYWRHLYEAAHEADPQNRPVTLVCVQNDYTKDIVTRTMDVVCINRYYGWYNLSGDIEAACHAWNLELDFWEGIGKPVMCTEYGGDSIPGNHGTVGEMFTEEFQAEYYRRIDAEFDKRDFMMGEHPWCFADFGTLQGVMRPDGNRKGVFTRERRPKLAAHFLKSRWEQIPNFGYKTEEK